MERGGGTRPDRPARVVIIDDDTALSQVVAIACATRPELDLVGEARSHEEAPALCERLGPDMVVLDLGSPAIHGLEMVRRLRSSPKAPRVLVFTGRGGGTLALAAMRAGVHGFLVKVTGIDEVASAMLAVARGELVFPPEQQQLAVQELGRLARTARVRSRIESTLTPRELAVLRLLAEGLTLRQTGTRLGISPRTVESHVAKLYRKLEVNTRVQAMAKAASLGLIEVDPAR